MADINDAAGELTAGLGAQGLFVNTDLRSDEQINTFTSRAVECFRGIGYPRQPRLLVRGRWLP